MALFATFNVRRKWKENENPSRRGRNIFLPGRGRAAFDSLLDYRDYSSSPTSSSSYSYLAQCAINLGEVRIFCSSFSRSQYREEDEEEKPLAEALGAERNSRYHLGKVLSPPSAPLTVVAVILDDDDDDDDDVVA